MNVRIVKIDTSGIELQLSRIADLLEGILNSTDPLKKWEGYAPSEDEPKRRVFTSNEDEEIVQHKLRQMGKEYTPRTARK